ncbi:MAG: hypothetical protein ACI8Z5_002488 [Lentimonas sp.]|jgi:hypothetical protein
MSRRFLSLTFLLGSLLILALGGIVAFRNTELRAYFRTEAANAVINDYVDHAVLQTLNLLVTDLDALNESARTLQATPSQAHLDSMIDRWHIAWATWMKDVAFQFGPATQYDYHKRLATWPVDKVLVEHSLSLIEADKLTIDSRYLREELFSGLRGLFTVKYLLLREGKPRDVATMSDAEMSYLSAVTQALLEESIDFKAAWCGTKNLSPSEVAIIQATSIKEKSAYGVELKQSGTPLSRYASESVVLQEIFQDISGVFEDMTSQISELSVESETGPAKYWELPTPCQDLINQLTSAQNAYLGGVEGSRGRALSELVIEHDEILDRRIKISFAHTAYRIEAVRNALDKPADERDLTVRRAESELEKLNARVGSAMSLVVLDSAMRPHAAYLNK